MTPQCQTNSTSSTYREQAPDGTLLVCTYLKQFTNLFIGMTFDSKLIYTQKTMVGFRKTLEWTLTPE